MSSLLGKQKTILDQEQTEKEREDRAMSNQELHQVRERLERKLAYLGTRRIDGLELGAGDEAEQALLETEADLAVATVNADWRITRGVRSALQRIETSEYGVCESCEKPIAESRLRALPWASRCVRCQAAEEEPSDGSLQFARFKADASGVFAGAAQ